MTTVYNFHRPNSHLLALRQRAREVHDNWPISYVLARIPNRRTRDLIETAVKFHQLKTVGDLRESTHSLFRFQGFGFKKWEALADIIGMSPSQEWIARNHARVYYEKLDQIEKLIDESLK